MKEKHLLSLVLAVGLIFGSVYVSAQSVMTQNYAYASTDNEEEDLADIQEEIPEQQEEDSETQTEESQPEDEDQVQTLSGGGSKKDTKGPTINSRSPNVGTVQIPVNTNIKVTFSEPVKSSSVTTSTFQLKNAVDATEVPGSVSLSADGQTATFDPTSDLTTLQSYTVTVTSGVKDLAGNSLNSENWSFTTEAQSSGGSSSGGSGSGGSTSSNASDPDVLRGSSEIDVLQEAAQFEADSKLLDRLLPILYKKIDWNALIANADGKKLLEKVLPYLDVKLTGRSQSTNRQTPTQSGLADAIATCNQDEVSPGGGFGVESESIGDGIPIFSGPSNPNSWHAQAEFDGDGKFYAIAQCMKVEVGIVGGEGMTTRSGTVDMGSDLGIKTSKDLDILKQPVP